MAIDVIEKLAFISRQYNCKNLWNPESKMMHPPEVDLGWMKDFTSIVDGVTSEIARVISPLSPVFDKIKI